MEKQAKVQDQIAMPSSHIKQHDEVSKRESETNDIGDRGQEARFGFTNIGSTGSVSIESGFFFSSCLFRILQISIFSEHSFGPRFSFSRENFIKFTLKNYNRYYFARLFLTIIGID